ncbi:MAG: porin family protein [Nitrospirae bacterium]|nr:porin family protein [Nitrospirota bacterium]
MKGKVVVLILIIILGGNFYASTCDAFQGPYAGINGQAGFVSDIELDGLDFKFDTGFGGGIAGGYDFGPIRMEGELAYRKNSVNQINVASWRSGSTDGEGDVTVTSFMVNAYFDFDNESMFIPYAGIGLGVAYISFNNVRASGVDLLDDSSSELASQLALGVGYTVNDFLIMDLGYRYFITDEIEFVESGNNIGDERYDSHNIMIGLRSTF